MKILVRRSGALGDVILATPVVRRLRHENPDAELFVETFYPDVFKNSPHIAGVNVEHRDYARIINLDLAYERHPSIHIIEAYTQTAFGDTSAPDDRQQELFYPIRQKLLAGRGFVAVHAAQAGWRNRTLPSATWHDVCRLLKQHGLHPIIVGTERDALPGYTSFLAPDLHAQTALIASCCCFVGSDSSLLHAAGATDVPIVGVFTCVRPEYRLPWRHGELGWRCRAVVPDLNCIGCQERQPAPTTTETCERGDIACVRSVTAEQIVSAVRELIGYGSTFHAGD